MTPTQFTLCGQPLFRTDLYDGRNQLVTGPDSPIRAHLTAHGGDGSVWIGGDGATVTIAKVSGGHSVESTIELLETRARRWFTGEDALRQWAYPSTPELPLFFRRDLTEAETAECARQAKEAYEQAVARTEEMAHDLEQARQGAVWDKDRQRYRGGDK